MDFPQLPSFLQTGTDTTSASVCPIQAHDLSGGCILLDASMLFAQRRYPLGSKVKHAIHGHGTVCDAVGSIRIVAFETIVQATNDRGDLECWTQNQRIEVSVTELELEN